MKITGYITGVRTVSDKYHYLDVEGLRIAVPSALADALGQLRPGREYVLVLKHTWFRSSNGRSFPRLELVAVEDS